MMDLESYFKDLKSKYGVSDNIRSLIEDLKKDCLKVYDGFSEEGRERQLRSIEARISVSYEIHMIHEDPEYKEIFALLKKQDSQDNESQRHEKKTGEIIKPILEGLVKELDSFKEKIDGIKLPEPPKPKKKR